MNAPGSALAEPAAVSSLAERLLGEGEEIILIVKPSLWQVILTSLPAVGVGAALMVAAIVIDRLYNLTSGPIWPLVLTVCGAMVLLRMAMMTVRWMGRLYVLTNLRVMRISGAVQTGIRDCPLRRIQAVSVMPAAFERPLGLGSLLFTVDGQLTDTLTWDNIAQPEKVADEIRRAIRRAGGASG